MSDPKTNVKKVSGLIREARTRWDAHENRSCRIMRDRALKAYQQLTEAERKLIPQELRVWLRYRSEKYFGPERTKPGADRKALGISKTKGRKVHAPQHAEAAKTINSPVGRLVILASKKGICGLFFGHRIELSTLPPKLERNRHLCQAEKELAEYFAGDRERFDLTLDARGTAFQRSVWRQLSQIPFGTTCHYGEIAEQLDNPGAVRAVGTANGANPISIIVPCHRVIGRDGSLTGFAGGLDIKRRLLEHEGFILRSPKT